MAGTAKMAKLNLEHVAKIEGHAKLHIKVKGGKVENVELRVLEGARFFEGILKDKKYNDLSHISSRICGVCSVVHTITSIKAIEDAFGITVSEQTNQLREALNIGGIIQSHALHLYFLTLPDYLGAESAIELARTNKVTIDRALRLKRLGNQIVHTLAGRDVHPIACVVGGFSRFPLKERIDALLEELKSRKEDAIKTVNLFMSLKYPDFTKSVPHFALTGGTYFYSDKIVRCEGGACFPTHDYKDHFKEYLVEGSTAEFATKEGKSYFVGALARVCNNIELLTNESKQYARKMAERKDNPFMNIPAQALEMLEGINRCIIILSNINLGESPCAENCVKSCECEGIAACEAPRGILFHHYKFDDKGYCTFADITTPTTQNLQHLEEAIKGRVQQLIDRSPDEVKLEIEKLIRAYDPCISCSTHFLELEWEAE
ncbi:Ni/Fe hydrogenase subunit alpha [Candidatus Woesearchaeota archaeon]|nr:Ni/Fe hydrogenase subunit alpha [Candidatus Woesearchaeota archaeon]